jgi:hypothetical protein
MIKAIYLITFLVCSIGVAQENILKKPETLSEIKSLAAKTKTSSTSLSKKHGNLKTFKTLAELKAYVKTQNKTTVTSKNPKEQKRPKNILVAPKTVSEIQSLKSN